MNKMRVFFRNIYKFLAHHKIVSSCKVGKDTAHPYQSYFQYAMLENRFTGLRTNTINSVLEISHLTNIHVNTRTL